MAEEVFVLPLPEGRFYVYSPLRRCVAVVNEAAASVVARYLEEGAGVLTPREQEVVREMEGRGLLGGTAPAPPVFPDDYEFQPHEVTLFLTSRCNLRCLYCYAEAGHKSVEMPWEVARAAIDLVAVNAGLLGSRRFAVGFHGGGEPTVAWDLLVRSTEYAHEKAEGMGLEAEVFCATNGLLSSRRREYIMKRFRTVNVSLDGPADIQDANRPRASGGGSFHQVRETLKEFDARGFDYGVRATITATTVSRMVEVVEYLRGQFKLSYLHMEPAWFCGRCLTTDERPPTDDEFIRNFVAARERGRELGVDVVYSGARLDVLTSRFCAAPGDSFTVLPEGLVTSCYEVTEAADPRARIFHYGTFDAASGGYRFDRERLAALRRLSVEHLPFCRDCFCKWHCAGDCLAKAFELSRSSSHQGTPRCGLNRALTRADLDAAVGRATGGNHGR